MALRGMRDPRTGLTATRSYTTSGGGGGFGGFGGLVTDAGGGLGPFRPGGFEPELRLGGEVAPSAEDLLREGGIALCEQFFSGDTCPKLADTLGLIFGGGGGGGGGTDPGTGLTVPPEKCPEGYRKDKSGACVFIGSPGEISTRPPGSLPPGAVAATTVGSIRGRPIRRCPRRFVLADPNLFGEGVCFHKAVITNKQRKWPKRPRAKISAADWKMMNRYGPGGSKVKKAKEFAQAAGFSCKKR